MSNLDSSRQPATIELKVEKVSQLFDTLDPFPFHERGLDREAEEYIVGWARELPRKRDINILVHLPEQEAVSENAKDIGKAFPSYFRYRAEIATSDLKELFRIGRYSLLIGVMVLAVCIIAGRMLSEIFRQSEIVRFFDEGLVILGWVANWRPIEIFLYEWWPLVRRRNLYRRLAVAQVNLTPR
jgi:hypothetical protein